VRSIATEETAMLKRTAFLVAITALSFSGATPSRADNVPTCGPPPFLYECGEQATGKRVHKPFRSRHYYEQPRQRSLVSTKRHVTPHPIRDYALTMNVNRAHKQPAFRMRTVSTTVGGRARR
jgi:hypothetical protein